MTRSTPGLADGAFSEVSTTEDSNLLNSYTTSQRDRHLLRIQNARGSAPEPWKMSGSPGSGCSGRSSGNVRVLQVGNWCRVNHAAVTSLRMVISSLWPIEKPKLTARNLRALDWFHQCVCGVGEGIILDAWGQPTDGLTGRTKQISTEISLSYSQRRCLKWLKKTETVLKFQGLKGQEATLFSKHLLGSVLAFLLFCQLQMSKHRSVWEQWNFYLAFSFPLLPTLHWFIQYFI